MAAKFQLKQHVWCTNDTHKSEVGVIAQIEEENAVIEDAKGNQYRENTYMVMLHRKNGKMYFEEFLESELELVTSN